MTGKARSSDLKDMLARKHEKDVFLPEVSIGPSSKKGYGRIDAWAMRRSYERPMIWGYEIKVSRSDFLRDDKWTAYMPICQQFYFVAPKGIISKDELPESVGLLEAVGNRLMTRRKAVIRDIDIPWPFIQSLIINRMPVGSWRQPDLSDQTWGRMDDRRKTAADVARYIRTRRQTRMVGSVAAWAIARALEDAKREKTRAEKLRQNLLSRHEDLERMAAELDELVPGWRYVGVKGSIRRLVSTAVAESETQVMEAIAVLQNILNLAEDGK